VNLPTSLRSWIPRLAINAAYRAVFTSPEGERVLRDLMMRGGVLETSVVEGDAGLTHFKEGRRSLVLDIIAELRFTEGDILRLARERSSEGPTPPQFEQDAA
jgi:hypothetical protein